MEKELFNKDGNTDPSDEELQQMMEEVGELIREESLKFKEIHEQRLKEIFAVNKTGDVHNCRS